VGAGAGWYIDWTGAAGALVIETLPLFTPQNEFVSEAFAQSTALVAVVATAAATCVA
jgi:hypothetical protein